jgi:hypothetical protein
MVVAPDPEFFPEAFFRLRIRKIDIWRIRLDLIWTIDNQ